jgi:hypothetical protein
MVHPAQQPRCGAAARTRCPAPPSLAALRGWNLPRLDPDVQGNRPGRSQTAGFLLMRSGSRVALVTIASSAGGLRPVRERSWSLKPTSSRSRTFRPLGSSSRSPKKNACSGEPPRAGAGSPQDAPPRRSRRPRPSTHCGGYRRSPRARRTGRPHHRGTGAGPSELDRAWQDVSGLDVCVQYLPMMVPRSLSARESLTRLTSGRPMSGGRVSMDVRASIGRAGGLRTCERPR